jgi:hypothetical protein
MTTTIVEVFDPGGLRGIRLRSSRSTTYGGEVTRDLTRNRTVLYLRVNEPRDSHYLDICALHRQKWVVCEPAST